MVDDDGRTTGSLPYYKLTYEPKGSGELNMPNLSSFPKLKMNMAPKTWPNC